MFSPLRGFPESTKQEIEIDGKGNYGKGVRYIDSYHCTVLITFLYVKIFIKMLGVGKKKKNPGQRQERSQERIQKNGIILKQSWEKGCVARLGDVMFQTGLRTK